MEVIRGAGLKLGVDPLGGAGVHYWGPINATYGLNIEIVNPRVDPTFAFMTVDLRWANPHGLLEPVCHGGADPAERIASASPSPTTRTPIGMGSSRPPSD